MSYGYEDGQRLNEKQKNALDKAAQRVRAITGSNLGIWDIAYRDEVRPGRGHDITAWMADGEHMAIQYLDPYGHGALVVSAIDLIHNDADEDHFNSLGHCGCNKGDA